MCGHEFAVILTQTLLFARCKVQQTTVYAKERNTLKVQQFFPIGKITRHHGKSLIMGNDRRDGMHILGNF